MSKQHNKKETIYIAGMHCRSCEVLLEESLSGVPGVSHAYVNHRKGTAVLTYGKHKPNREQLRQAVDAAGYQITDSQERLPWFSRDIETYVNLLFALGAAFVLSIIASRFGWFDMSFGGGNIDVSRVGFVLLLGLTAGISTCAALVGGLVLGVSARYNTAHPELSVQQKFIPHIWFNAGRVVGFGVFGALLGVLGEWLQASIGFTALLTLLAGLIMVFLGLQLSQLFPRLRQLSFTLPKGVSRLLGLKKHENAEYSHKGAFALGALTFFLPCGFTQAVQLAVIALGSPVLGAMALSVFALGTVPGLLALGGLGTAIRGSLKNVLFAFIAVVLIAFGAWNTTSGLQLFGFNTLALGARQEAGESLKKPGEKSDIQVVRMTQDTYGYRPNKISLEAGVPVRLIVNSVNSYTCASSFVIPQMKIRTQLKKGENTIEFTPTKKGKIPFSCSMGMYRGVFIVE